MNKSTNLFLSLISSLFFVPYVSAQIVVTEVMQNPSDVTDGNGEWVEIYNSGTNSVDIDGWTIGDNDSDSHVIDNGGPLLIAPNSFLVLGSNSDQPSNGDVPVDYQWSSITLANGADELVLLDGSLAEIDRVEWDGGANWPDPDGASMIFVADPGSDNNDFNNWATAASRQPNFGMTGTETDFGSPGSNGTDQSLPVELTSFSALGEDQKVTLKWTTAAEVNNQGFIILRANAKDAEYMEISSYKYNEELIGAGTSSTQHKYKYIDETVFNGNTYWYKLIDVDFNGVMEEHGPISVTPHLSLGNKEEAALPKMFFLYQNYPNPFNPSTTITYDVPQLVKIKMEMNISVYNILGQKVAELLRDPVDAGRHSVKWNGLDQQGNVVPAGIYIYQITSELFTQSKKMMYLK